MQGYAWHAVKDYWPQLQSQHLLAHIPTDPGCAFGRNPGCMTCLRLIPVPMGRWLSKTHAHSAELQLQNTSELSCCDLTIAYKGGSTTQPNRSQTRPPAAQLYDHHDEFAKQNLFWSLGGVVEGLSASPVFFCWLLEASSGDTVARPTRLDQIGTRGSFLVSWWRRNDRKAKGSRDYQCSSSKQLLHQPW